MTWTVSIGIAIIAAIVGFVIYRGWQVTRLAHHGVVAMGTVIKRGRQVSSRGGLAQPWLRYEYEGPDGTLYEYKVFTTEDFWQVHDVGDPIEIAYLESKPSVSGARYLINESRKVPNLPPL